VLFDWWMVVIVFDCVWLCLITVCKYEIWLVNDLIPRIQGIKIPLSLLIDFSQKERNWEIRDFDVIV